jgi:small subunit ribosomal protein S18
MAKKKKEIRPRRKLTSPKKCFFCEEKKEPTYADVETLQKFLTERGKIMGRARNGLCAKHQRHLTLNIKYARHLALLPFISRD